MANSDLNAAKKAKNDEFYTQYADIEKEVNAYLDYAPDTFRGKTVLLPCDDPEWSKFTRFFAENFERLGLKKLISTSYAFASKNLLDAKNTKGENGSASFAYSAAGKYWQPTLFESESPQYDAEKTAVRGKIFVLDRDTNGSGRIDLDDLQWSYLDGDGDFRSDEVRALRDEADVIVTNPPFSLFRDFLAWIMEAGKKFLIIGSMNAIKYKDIFPFIKTGQIWLGNGFQNGNAYFRPLTSGADDYAEGVFDSETGLVKFRNCCWFTNLDHGRRHCPLQLLSLKDNRKYSRHREIREHGYLRYFNFNAIEVPFVDAIPCDFDGMMGVPISFLDKYCPEQFELVGMSLDLADMTAVRRRLGKSDGGPVFYVEKDGHLVRLYDRLVIRRRTELGNPVHPVNPV